MIVKEHPMKIILNNYFVLFLLILVCSFFINCNSQNNKEERYFVELNFEKNSYVLFQNNTSESVYLPKNLLIEQYFTKMDSDSIILGSLLRDSILTPNYYNPEKLIEIKSLEKKIIPIENKKLNELQNSQIYLRIFKKDVVEIYNTSKRKLNYFDLENNNTFLIKIN